ncbi:MAG TPA: chemotaxis-specific protein-glutamate methyltransferase CheB [Haliangium sp.]|nr:chemotaxis-specific protein-glutamate methyltransferase CheB [Haliangium sp.]
MTPIRVLIVDDSAFTRKVLREMLESAVGLSVVGTARDGLDALDKIAELAPDVVTLDLVMPGLDGLGVLRALPRPGSPRVIVVSASAEDSELGIEALQSGAVDLVHKPTSLATDRLYEISAELIAKVVAAASARPLAPESAAPAALPALPALPASGRTGLVVIGTSTGGPQALTRLLTAMPGDFPAPIAVALHIPYGYTEALARRLDGIAALRIVEASEGLELTPGMAAIAPGGLHMKLQRDEGRLVTRLGVEPIMAAYRPSVDALFESAAQTMGGKTLGVVLTGMGDDGYRGARAIRDAGGRVLTESADSCVIDGMPRVVREAGLSSAEATIDEMAALIVRQL